MDDRRSIFEALKSVPTVIKVFTPVVAVLVSIAGTGMAFEASRAKMATKDDVRVAIAEHNEKVRAIGDHNRSPHPPYAEAIAAQEKATADLSKSVEEQRELILEVMRMQVSGLAADAEPDRRRKAQARSDAIDEFDRLIADKVPPAKAARRALELPPPRR